MVEIGNVKEVMFMLQLMLNITIIVNYSIVGLVVI